MSALTANRETDRKDGDLVARGVALSTTVYRGGMVCLNSSGYAVSAAANSTYVFDGVAYEKADNSSGANGAKDVRVWRRGWHTFAATGMAITDVGKPVWVSDDQTVTLTPGLVFAGIIAEYISATSVRVDIESAVALAKALEAARSSDRATALLTYNDSGASIAEDSLVYLSGYNTTYSCPTIAKAQGTSAGLYAQYITVGTIANNAAGLVTTRKMIDAQDTSGGSVGDPAYLSDGTAGAWTLTKPTATDKVQIAGRVATSHATTGRVWIDLTAGVQQIVHTHATNAEGGQLDWDDVWSDAVHTHASTAEGGTIYGYAIWNFKEDAVAISQTDVAQAAFQAPFALTITEVCVWCSAITATASVDVKEAGTTILSAAITPSAAANVIGSIADGAIADNASVTVHVTTDGSGAITDLVVTITFKALVASA